MNQLQYTKLLYFNSDGSSNIKDRKSDLKCITGISIFTIHVIIFFGRWYILLTSELNEEIDDLDEDEDEDEKLGDLRKTICVIN